MQSSDTTLLDLLEHLIFVVAADADGTPRYVAVNAFACRAIGLPAKDIIGRTAQELYPGLAGDIAYDHHVKVLQTKRSLTYEVQLPLADGPRRLRTTLRPDCDADGNVTRLLGSSLDITATPVFQHGPAASGDTSTESTEMEDFVALAAHDLRAPMRQVVKIAELMAQDFQDLGDGKVQLINLLQQLGASAMDLIGDVLTYAEASRTSSSTIAFSFEDLAKDVLSLLDPTRTCNVTCDPGIILGDRTAVHVVLRNLVDNAIKHGRTATLSTPLELNFGLSDLGNGYIRFSVQDNGTGFADPAILFLDDANLFSRGGYGLLGVRRLLHARGGCLTMSNRVRNPGAEVSFTLPGALHKTTLSCADHQPALAPRSLSS